MTKTIELIVIDHPNANGRVPETDEYGYTLWFSLETGDRLALKCGKATFNDFATMIAEMMVDDKLQNLGGK